MEVVFTPEAIEHLNEWRKSGNIGIQNKITELLVSIKDTPFKGSVNQKLSKWSRRINNEHRVVYSLDGETINIYSLKGHYKL